MTNAAFDRRQFARGAVASAFAGLSLAACAGKQATTVAGVAPRAYGPLVADPAGVLDLPQGFSYRVISALGDAMDDGFTVPDRADGMGCFRIDRDRVALVRNHELAVRHATYSAARSANLATYDRTTGGAALAGGTTTLVYDMRARRVTQQYLSLIGTIRNCAGGITPWGSWLTCEEDVTRAGDGVMRDHGYIFEVPALARGLVDPVPLIAMGRRNHEAACVDPRTGIVYMTEDRGDSLFYRFLPNVRGELAKGGRLQALVIDGMGDSRNWSGIAMPTGSSHRVRWVDLDRPEAPGDDLRNRGAAKGATLFARGEGIHWGNGELYFTCTNGGAAKFGQIMRYRPSRREGQADEAASPGMMQLFVESTSGSELNYGDNLTVAPNGHLLVCEDQYTDTNDNHLRGVTPDGRLYPFARLRLNTETAGACFSPDGSTLFVNVYSPTKTLAITGPWASFSA